MGTADVDSGIDVVLAAGTTEGVAVGELLCDSVAVGVVLDVVVIVTVRGVGVRVTVETANVVTVAVSGVAVRVTVESTVVPVVAVVVEVTVDTSDDAVVRDGAFGAVVVVVPRVVVTTTVDATV